MTMKTLHYESGPWQLECVPADGARLNWLRYDGYDLLTAAPKKFSPPKRDLGEYELRPVYGYDDCFPSIRPCAMPGFAGVNVRDHGDVCWQKWKVATAADRFEGRVASPTLPVTFTRSMRFGEKSLTWHFEAVNDGQADVPFLHAIHPMMPPEKIAAIELPGFAQAVSEMRSCEMEAQTPAGLVKHLLSRPEGAADMMLLKGLTAGRVKLSFRDGPAITMTFDPTIFPTLGIWWNRRGYPDEPGLHRSESGFEPIPGTNSSLQDSAASGVCMTIPAGGRSAWEVLWTIG
jgi:hypothetical protein